VSHYLKIVLDLIFSRLFPKWNLLAAFTAQKAKLYCL
jgi:hypothetical protein